MIKTATQLKAKIRNMAQGDSTKAQSLVRLYVMERFLERCALSPYREHVILKGGMLVSSYVGLNTRTTMDIDATLRAYPLTLEHATRMMQDIISVTVEDGIVFQLVDAQSIMQDHDYPGLRFTLEGRFDRIRQIIKVDISTDDAITPAAVEYSYPLIFEDRTIEILSYNIETLLAEKMETIISRAEANTRMRDYYDIYAILKERSDLVDIGMLRAAFQATYKRRNGDKSMSNVRAIISSLRDNKVFAKQWDTYRSNNYYVGALEWTEVLSATGELANKLQLL